MYLVEVVITNKRSVRDPEGETIHKELISRRGYANVKDVRSGKYLEFLVDSQTPEEALNYVRDICHKLRIYNPVVHDIKVRLSA
ncbi:MAG: phosphoribosylformylglycinamidine synthase subunit PurS [Sulfolobales archaeon]